MIWKHHGTLNFLIHLKPDTSQHILALARAETNAPKRLRLLAIYHFLETGNRAQISRILKVRRCSVNKWVASYLADGLLV